MPTNNMPYQHISRGRWMYRYVFLRQIGNKCGRIIFLLLQNNNTDSTHSIRFRKQKQTKKCQQWYFWKQTAGIAIGTIEEILSPVSHALTNL